LRKVYTTACGDLDISKIYHCALLGCSYSWFCR